MEDELPSCDEQAFGDAFRHFWITSHPVWGRVVEDIPAFCREPVAALAEHQGRARLAHNPEVAGSDPARHTSSCRIRGSTENSSQIHRRLILCDRRRKVCTRQKC